MALTAAVEANLPRDAAGRPRGAAAVMIVTARPAIRVASVTYGRMDEMLRWRSTSETA